MIKSKPDNIGRNNRHKKNQSVNIFDKRSLQYNDLNWVFDPNFAKVIFRFINPLISDILLDLGTGTGAIPLFLYKYVLKVYALDLSIQMVKKAQALLGDAPNVEFVVADGLNTCFYYESFNVIVCRNSLHHYDDPVAGLQEIYRILIKKGRFILIEPVAPNQKGKTVVRVFPHP